MSAMSAQKRFLGKICGGSRQFAHVDGTVEQGRGAAQVLPLYDRPVNSVDEFLAFFGVAGLCRDEDSGRLAGDRAVIWRNVKWSREGVRG